MKTPFNMPYDKFLHFIVGGVMALILVPLFGSLGFISVVVVAAAKEVLHDKLLKKGNCEFMDFIWTIIPALIIYLVFEFVV